MAEPKAVILNEEKDNKEKNAKLKKFLRQSGSTAIVEGASAVINKIGSATHLTNHKQTQDDSSITESSSTRDMPYENILEKIKLRSSFANPRDDTDTLEDPLDTLRHWRREFPRRYSYLNLYCFSSGLDRLHMIIGIVAAIVGGLCIPTVIYLFGKMVRKMVLVEKIQRSMSCTTQFCRKFLASCTVARPFNGRPLDKALLTTVVSDAMSTFSLWATVAAAVYTICSSVYFICWHVAADNQIGRLRRKYFEALLRKDMTWFDTQTDPESISRLMDHTRRIHEGIGENVPIALNLLITVICCILLAFSKAWSLTFIALGLVLILLLTSVVVTITEGRRMTAEIRAYKFANDLATEVFTNAKTMIFYSGQRKEIIRYKKELQRDFGKVAKWSLLHSIAVFIYWLITFLSWAVVMWFGVSVVLHDQSCGSSPSPYYMYDAGDMFIVIFSILFGAGNVYLVAPMAYAMRVARNYGTRVFQVIDGPRGIDNMGTEGTIIVPFNGNIEFQDVRFTYPLNKDNVVLNHFTMKVPGGSNVAIVGVNGCGKTSIFKLITKEYLPDSGFIKIDGEDIRNVNTNWLRSQIGYVPQTPVIFDDTVENNIRMGKPDAAFFEIQEACVRANAHDFIVSLKGAYQTRVGAGGTKLSAGQRQRLAIARALVRNPKILLLDEHTSSLDPESESLVLDTIQKASLERTVIIITHRLHLAVHCENIFVIKGGKVLEKGIHSHLLKNKGAYSQLASGAIDKPSTSIKSAPTLPKFDGSLINIAYLFMLFGVQRPFPSLYNSRFTLSPAVLYVSQIFMKQVAVSNIPMQSVNHHVDDEFYVLENSDSIKENDSVLTKSEVDFRESGSRKDFISANQNYPVVNPVNAEAEIEGISEIFDPSKYSAIQVIGLASRASYKIILFICVILSICMGFILPVFAVLIARSVEIISNPNLWFFAGNWKRVAHFNAEDDAVKLFIMFVFLGIASGGIAAILDFCVSMSGYRLTLYLKKKMFAAIIRQDLSFFDNPIFNVGALRNFLSIDVIALRFLVKGMFNVIPQTCATVVVAVVLAASIYAGNLTAYTFVLVLFISAINFIDSLFARKQKMANTEAMKAISSLIWQVFEGKHNVTVMQLEPFFLEKFTKIHNAAFTERRRITYFRALSFGFSQTSVFWGYAAFIYIASHEIQSGRADFRATIAIGQLLIFGLIFVGANLAIIPCFKVAISAGKNLLSVLSRRPRIPIELPGAHIDCKGEIGFHDVHFWHPYSGADNPFLRGVTFTVPPGKTVGIVGSSESGKSAYLDLVMRLFDVPNGSITLDDKNLKDLSVRSLRRVIGYVEREPQLFKRTVAENIAYGDNTHKLLMKDIVVAADMAHMHNFICSLPDGYETRIGAPNERLSTAQKQRICIARAILRRPKILLIDEPTNNLDRDGEKLVLESLEKVKEGLTCIIVAHRLVAVQKADLIVVMTDGLVSEIGTHEQLLKNANGAYANLWKSQNPLEDESFLNATDPVHKNFHSKVPQVSPHAPGHLSLPMLANAPNSTGSTAESQAASSSIEAPQRSKTDAGDEKETGCLMCGSFGAR